MREGLHLWVLSVLVAWALAWPLSGTPPTPGVVIRIVLALRLGEVMAMAVVPSVAFHHALTSSGHRVTDAVAVGSMVVATGGLAWLTLRGPDGAATQVQP